MSKKFFITIRTRRRWVAYFLRNPGAIFVAGFQVLLISAAIALINGDSVLASEVAVYSYYSLVIGVVLLLFVLVKKRPEQG